MNGKKIIIQVLILLILVGMYMAKDFLMFDAERVDGPAVEQEQQENESLQTDITQTMASEQESTQSEEFIFHYAAQQPDPDRTLPRQKYELDMPQTQRSDSFTEACLPLCEPVESSYFDDVVFLGDSYVSDFQDYVAEQRLTNSEFFGSARFICVENYSVEEAIQPVTDTSMHMSVNGQKYAPEELLKQYQAKKVYICLGFRDVARCNVDDFIENYKKLTESIAKQNDGIMIVVQTIPPVPLYGEKESIYNAKIDTYNERLAEFAKQSGYYFADPALRLKDDAGYLAQQLCLQEDGRLNQTAYEIWSDYLMKHAVR